jgi:hypothetical protein
MPAVGGLLAPRVVHPSHSSPGAVDEAAGGATQRCLQQLLPHRHPGLQLALRGHHGHEVYHGHGAVRPAAALGTCFGLGSRPHRRAGALEEGLQRLPLPASINRSSFSPYAIKSILGAAYKQWNECRRNKGGRGL